MREMLQETGSIVAIERFGMASLYPLADYPGPNITFFFEAQSTGGQLRGSEEGQTAVFPLAQFPPIAPTRKGSTHAMQLYLARRQEEKSR